MKRNLLTTFCVLFGLVISETGFSQNHFITEYVEIQRDAKKNNYINIAIACYDYAFGPNSEHGYLERCTFEASADGEIYYKLMDVNTKHQNKSNRTHVYLRNKLEDAQILFLSNVLTPFPGTTWNENRKLRLTVRSSSDLALFCLGWLTERNVRSVQISGTWRDENLNVSIPFKNIVYPITRPRQSMLVSKTDSAKVFKESDAIAIKGAEPGANIKVYTTSGTVIKSVVSNNDVVKINLPTKQIYSVHVGKSQYKVAL